MSTCKFQAISARIRSVFLNDLEKNFFEMKKKNENKKKRAICLSVITWLSTTLPHFLTPLVVPKAFTRLKKRKKKHKKRTFNKHL